MEIISYVLEGTLEHRDSLGHGTRIGPGEVQRMSAGTGIRHSEFNPSSSEPVHFLQIWIIPSEQGLTPGYEQKAFPLEERRGRLRLVASADGADGSLTVHQDARLYIGNVHPGEKVQYAIGAGRGVWVQAVRGIAALNGDVRVVLHEEFLAPDNALGILAQYDLVVNGSDNFATRYLVGDACVLLGRPLVDAAILRFEGQFATYLPGEACYRCLFPTPPPPGTPPACAA
jgi:redox-sensitive bicupin YhaK (pirin superfamily)